MARGSQPDNGTWALLPSAANTSSSAAGTATVDGTRHVAVGQGPANTRPKSPEPTAWWITTPAASRPMSQIR